MTVSGYIRRMAAGNAGVELESRAILEDARRMADQAIELEPALERRREESDAVLAMLAVQIAWLKQRLGDP